MTFKPAYVVDEPPRPGTDDWRRYITASKVPAILGLSPWQSPYALWHEMKGLLDPTPPDSKSDMFLWGHMAEESLAQWWKAKNPGWKLNQYHGRGDDRTAEVAYTNPQLDFPNMATLDRRGARGQRFCIIECKTTSDLSNWGRPDEVGSVPIYYQAQVMFQMLVSEIHTAYVVVTGYRCPEIHTVAWDEDLAAMIAARCYEWHKSLASDTPPDLDDTVATYEAVRGLHPNINPDGVVQVGADQATLLLDAMEDKAAATRRERFHRAKLLDQMGEAKKALVGDQTLAIRSPGRGDAVTLRVNKKVNLAA